MKHLLVATAVALFFASCTSRSGQRLSMMQEMDSLNQVHIEEEMIINERIKYELKHFNTPVAIQWHISSDCLLQINAASLRTDSLSRADIPEFREWLNEYYQEIWECNEIAISYVDLEEEGQGFY